MSSGRLSCRPAPSPCARFPFHPRRVRRGVASPRSPPVRRRGDAAIDTAPLRPNRRGIAMTILDTALDPLVRLPRAERPAYATGMLLDAQDFQDEQTYHRARLARALSALAGSGTLAGLEVQYVPA